MIMARGNTRIAKLFILAISLFPVSTFAADECSSSFTPPTDAARSGVTAVLETVPPDATWASLPDQVKSQLQALADKRLAAFRASWDGKALAAKENILLNCPTPEMAAAMDDYFRRSYIDEVSPAFNLADLDPALKRPLVRTYLSTLASYRSSNHYSAGFPDRDWDGISKFDSIRLPDVASYRDMMAYAQSAVLEIRALDATKIPASLSRLFPEVLFDMRSRAKGSIGDSFGGFDMERVYQRIWEDYSLLEGYDEQKRPDLFHSDDEVLTEANAYYLGNIPFRGLDRGTLRGAVEYRYFSNPDEIAGIIGDTNSSFVSQRMIQMKNWWLERTRALPDASKKCTIYPVAERADIWEAFTADQRLNNDGSSSMDDLKSSLDAYRISMIGRYRQLAEDAVGKVFPDDKVITSEQRQQLIAWIGQQSQFGIFRTTIAQELDRIQTTTNGPAASQWTRAFNEKVKYLGGYKPDDEISSTDQTIAQSLFDNVKDWVGKQYPGYPIDVQKLTGSLTEFEVTKASNSFTDTQTARVQFGIGTPRSYYEHYSTLLHELRHALAAKYKSDHLEDPTVASDIGYAVEGSGNAVERMVLERFASSVIADDVALTLYKLDYGIRDARIVGTTDATLQVFYRPDCSGVADPDTIDFVKTVVAGYGLTGELGENAVRRAHTGSGYLQYAYGEQLIMDDIGYLDHELGLAADRGLDPYILFACGLNLPQRNQEYINELRVCLKKAGRL
jgi:hypothetical protein